MDLKPVLYLNQSYTLKKLKDYTYKGNITHYEKGEKISIQGKKFFLLVLKGRIDVLITRYDSEDILFATLVPGQSVSNFYDNENNFDDSRRLICVRDTTVCSFSKEVLLNIMQEDIEVLEEVVMQLMSIINMSHYRILATNNASATKRLLLFLRNLCLNTEPDENKNYHLKTNINQRELSQYLGLHYTTCNRLIKCLAYNNIISITKRKIVVHNLKKIEELIESENILHY